MVKLVLLAVLAQAQPLKGSLRPVLPAAPLQAPMLLAPAPPAPSAAPLQGLRLPGALKEPAPLLRRAFDGAARRPLAAVEDGGPPRRLPRPRDPLRRAEAALEGGRTQDAHDLLTGMDEPEELEGQERRWELYGRAREALHAAYLEAVEPADGAALRSERENRWVGLPNRVDTPRQKGGSCVVCALYNAVRSGPDFTEEVSPGRFLAWAGETLGDADKPTREGLTTGELQTLAAYLGGRVRAAKLMGSEARMRALLKEGRPVLATLRYYHPDPARGRPAGRAALHEVLVQGAFWSPTRRAWVFLVQDSGVGRPTFYSYALLRTLVEELHVLELPGPVSLDAWALTP